MRTPTQLSLRTSKCLPQVVGMLHWRDVSETCGLRIMMMVRSFFATLKILGFPCPSYYTSICAVDCEVTDWGKWSGCSVTCGNGTETRNRSVTVQQEYLGKECPDLVESRACNPDPCPGLMMITLHKIRITPQLTVNGSGRTGATAQQLVKEGPR